MNTRSTSLRAGTAAFGCRAMLVLLHAMLGASAAWAATTGAVLEEITVTAQKRSESLQEVPVTVQAFTGDQLEAFGVNQITDVTRLAPNLNVVVQNAMSQHIVIRGVGTNEFFGNAPSSVGVYMDEVTMNSSYLSTLGLFDMERVEVLRGPQNSLFGRNTTGGAVNYISRLPQVGEALNGYGGVMYGSHDRIEVEGAVSAPLGSSAAVRLAGKFHTRDGRWNNVDSGDHNYGDTERYSVRGTLIWEPQAETTITGSFHVARDRSQAQPQKAFGTLANNPPLRLLPDEQTIAGTFTSDIDFQTPVPYVTSQGFNVVETDWSKVRTGGSQRADLDVEGGYLKIRHDFGTVTLTSITSYDHTHGFYEEDNGVSGLSAGLNQEALLIDMDQEYEQITQELRLSSDDDTARFRWITGIYYLTEDSTLGQDIRFGDNGVLAFHPVVNGVPPSVFGFPDTPAGFFAALDAIPNPFTNTAGFSIAKLEDSSFSAYGHTVFEFTDKLNVIAGLRWTHDDKSNPSFFAGSIDITGIPQNTYYGTPLLRQLTAGLPACPSLAVAPPFTIGCANDNTTRPDIKTSEFGGKVGLDYHITDDVMVYGSYSRGFKSGKFDVEFLHSDVTPFPQRSLGVEVLNVYELGVKSTWLQGAMHLNGAFFYNKWTDQQVFNVGSRGPEFFNLPESRILGGEIEMQWIPAESWLITGALGFLDSEITDATGIDYDLGQGEFQKGHELPLAPDVTGNWALIKDFVIGNNQLTIQFDGHYQSSSKVKFKPSYPIDEYEARLDMNARADYVFGNEQQYKIGVFVENLTAEKYCLEKQDLHALVGAYYCVPNEGETQFGVQGRVSF